MSTLVNPLLAIGVYDGRYQNKTKDLESICSQYAFTRNRIHIGAQYFYHLMSELKHNDKVNLDLWYSELIEPTLYDKMLILKYNPDNSLDMTPMTPGVDDKVMQYVDICIENERKTNHDVAGIVQFLRDKYTELSIGPEEFKGYIHLGLTSQDLNTSANYMIMASFQHDIFTTFHRKIVKESLLTLKMEAEKGHDYMLSLTHGQPATPTTMGWTIGVFIDRLDKIKNTNDDVLLQTKFGGASGGFNSIHALDSNIDIINVAKKTCDEIGLNREPHTTQVDSYYTMIESLNHLHHYNMTLYDMCHDIWYYISRGVFCLKVVKDEVGSSAMPHKVNPINFENAMGNISIANGLIDTFRSTLPVSIMQRDLRDSTILRQLGNIFAGCLVAWKSIVTGLERLEINNELLKKEIDDNIVVTVEGLQTILRFCGHSTAYDQFKEHTRGKHINKEMLLEFIEKVELHSDFVSVAYHGKKTASDVKELMRNVILKPEVYFTNHSINK